MLARRISLIVLITAIAFTVLSLPGQQPTTQEFRNVFAEHMSLLQSLAGGILLFIGGYCFILQNRGLGLFFVGLGLFFLARGMIAASTIMSRPVALERGASR